ncbi:MAG: hypothetical protein EBZ48_12210 [Proteobacteria bacterium]|nr:hypothetical protein [Pseudomonadota bacterium]
MKRFFGFLLLPVARFCVRNGVSLRECTDALKAALLAAGMEQLNQQKEPITSSRLSVMTGVHRKDAANFLKGAAPERSSISPAVKVLGCWHSKRNYRDARGKPRSLSIGTEESEFARLVREVSADIHPATVLRELERLELVQVKDHLVAPLKSHFVSALEDDGTARLIARDIDELLSAAEENIKAKGPRPHHHTTTVYDNIPIEYANELRSWINREAAQFHAKVREHVAQYDRDLADSALRDEKGGTARFAFGSFGKVMASGGDDAEND